MLLGGGAKSGALSVINFFFKKVTGIEKLQLFIRPPQINGDGVKKIEICYSFAGSWDMRISAVIIEFRFIELQTGMKNDSPESKAV